MVNASGSMGSSRWSLCEHYECRHSYECCKLIGGCFKCGSKEHFLKDCPHRVEVSQTQNSTPSCTLAKVRGRANGKPIGQLVVSHIFAIQVETRDPARVYAIREPQGQDSIDKITGVFVLQSTPLFLLANLGCMHS